MATLKPELKTILDKYGIDPRDKSQLWDCHGTLVLYHRAYEIIAAKEGIRFDPPQVIQGDGEKKIVAVLVVGHMRDRSEWSFGEAMPANCKNAYPYATAEKRAKDRVIAKLVGLAAYVYSEDEADEFKDAKPAPLPVRNDPPAPAANPVSDDLRTLYEDLLKGVYKEPSVQLVNEYLRVNKADIETLRLHAAPLFVTFKERVELHRGNLSQKPAA